MAGWDLSVAIVGATGAVGREMLAILEKRPWRIRELRLFASPRSHGRRLSFRGRRVPVGLLGRGAFAGVDVALFDASTDVSRRYVPQALVEGARVVDNSSAYRLDRKVPLVVPEVNGALARGARLVAGPNCTTIPLVMTLAPLARAYGLARVVVATYQAVSGAGSAAARALTAETRARLSGRPPRATVFSQPMAFNCVAHETFAEGGYTDEEWKMIRETRRLLDLPRLPIVATAVRVPVYRGHSEAVFVTTHRRVTPAAARAVLARMPGVRVEDDPAQRRYPTPLSADGQDAVLVGRLREDPSTRHGLALWLSCDNLRKGAALNAVQIAETMLVRERPAIGGGRGGQ